jgi:hypothetical protein
MPIFHSATALMDRKFSLSRAASIALNRFVLLVRGIKWLRTIWILFWGWTRMSSAEGLNESEFNV